LKLSIRELLLFFFFFLMPKLLVEFVGTFFLVLVVALTGNPLAIGTILMVMVYAGGHISGAHYNPAVTVGLLMSGKVKNGDAIGYILAQLLGAFVAAAVSFWLTGKGLVPMIGSGFDMGQALLVEILFTFALVTVVLNTAATKATAGNSYFGLAIGFTVLAAAYAGGAISGGAFNPAVGVSPLLFDMLANGVAHSHLWLYIVGPVVGGVLASLYHSYSNGLKMSD
jgi:aquaporin Z